MKDRKIDLGQAYHGVWFKDICTKINIKDEKHFRNFLVDLGKDYKRTLKNTSIQTSLTEQNQVLLSLANWLDKAISAHSDLYKNQVASARLDYALADIAGENEYEPLALDTIINEFRRDEEGYFDGYGSHQLDRILKFFKEATERALEEPIEPFTKSFRKSKLIRYWVACIGARWPEDSPLTFSTGRYYKELGRYKSETIDILHHLLLVVDPEATIQNVSSALKYVQDNKGAHPSVFLLTG